ncbi:MAG: peptidase M28 [Acidobacteria bacterium]|nr:MAG: peptidase M28 [Acidobacteriota bacterium]
MVRDLYPICRSITGNGLRQSLRYLQQTGPMVLREVPTGTPVLDWTVPKEWNIREAWIKSAQGEKVVDFAKCNLHVVNYSVPVRRRIRLAELKEHLFSLSETPDWIPYRTSYYHETWGFCLAHRQLAALKDEEYEVCIDSTLEPGHLTYGELKVQGATEAEMLISVHSCHPSLCNDNLSGMVVAARLAQCLLQLPLRYSYRFLWIPGTIGAITWLALNEGSLTKIKHGLVLSCVGDPGHFTYKRSRHGKAEIDRIVEHVLKESGNAFDILDFTPSGYDERQYCSPGINLPVGCFMRTPNGKYPQYHTSADDLKLVTPAALAESFCQLLTVVKVLEGNQRFVNLNPKCEPQLGRRGLYRAMGGTSSTGLEEAILWVLSFSDGTHSLLDIAARSGVGFEHLEIAANLLLKHGLLSME